jgi:signal transduction histidine kinase
MWNNLPLRTRITAVGAMCLLIMSLLLTLLISLRVTTTMFIPGKTLSPYLISHFADFDEQELVEVEVDDAVLDFQLDIFVYMLAIDVSGTWLIWYAAGRALRPLSAFEDAIEHSDETTLKIELPDKYQALEIRNLTESFNGMLERVQFAYTGQKNFAQNAAHELKQPVAAIMANLDILHIDENPDVTDYKEAVDSIEISAVRMQTLVKDLLMLNTVLKKEDFEVFDAGELFAEIISDHSKALKERNIKVKVEGESLISANRILLQRAFDNLFGNAIRYNLTCPVQTENISQLQENIPGQFVQPFIHIRLAPGEISIENTGYPIAKEHLARLFEPFYVVDASRSKELGGSGLGLSIVKRIIDQHGFTISAASDQTTVMTVSFPEVELDDLFEDEEFA